MRLLPAIVTPTFGECHIRRITLGLRPRLAAVHGTGLADPVPRLLWRDLVRDCEQAGLDESRLPAYGVGASLTHQ